MQMSLIAITIVCLAIIVLIGAIGILNAMVKVYELSKAETRTARGSQ
jgi:hypothetical protein